MDIFFIILKFGESLILSCKSNGKSVQFATGISCVTWLTKRS